MNKILMVEGLIYAVGCGVITIFFIALFLGSVIIILNAAQENIYKKLSRLYLHKQLLDVMKELEAKGKAKLIKEINSDE